MDGMEPIDGVGLFITCSAFWSGAFAKLDSVPTLEIDILRAGEAGRAAGVKGEGEGFGLVCGGLLDGCRGKDGTAGGGATVAEAAVGVAWGVVAAEFAFATDIGVGVCLAFAEGGWCVVPSSPGANVRAEQKPSEELMSSVWPSLDHVRSVKVA